MVESFAGLHLNLRAPNRVAIELMVLSAAATAAFGLDAPAEAVAHTHAGV